MKKTFIFLALVTSIFSLAQMAVTDVGVTLSMTEQLAKSTAQLATLEKNYEILKKSAEKLEKVNSAVNGVIDMKNIIALQREAIENANIINQHNQGDSKYDISARNSLVGGLSNINKSIDKIMNILKPGHFSMTDKERIDLLEKERSKVFMETFKTRIKANPYK